jgi:hypothetical protein
LGLARRSQKILLGEIDAAMAQDVIGRRDVKKELRHAEGQQQGLAGKVSRRAISKRKHHFPVAGIVDRRGRRQRRICSHRLAAADEGFRGGQFRYRFDEIANGNADLMMTDASETRYQQKLHPGVFCAVHPEQPFDFAEKAYLLQRDAALKALVDQWLHITVEDGSFKKIYAAWFE